MGIIGKNTQSKFEMIRNGMKSFDLPPINTGFMPNGVKSPLSPTYAIEDDDDFEIDELPNMDDRIHTSSGFVYPNFIRDELELKYFDEQYETVKENGTIILSSDINALGMLALNYALIDKCNFAISGRGMNIMVPGDRKRIMKRNPALDVLKDAQAAVRYWSKEFKTTPGSRGNHGGIGASGVKSGTLDNFDDI